MNSLLFQIADLVMLGSMLGIITFTISYGAFFSWRKTAAGRSIMYLALSLDAWAIQSFVSRIDPAYPGRGWTRLVVYIFIFLTVWSLVVTLWRAWHRNRKREDL